MQQSLEEKAQALRIRPVERGADRLARAHHLRTMLK